MDSTAQDTPDDQTAAGSSPATAAAVDSLSDSPAAQAQSTPSPTTSSSSSTSGEENTNLNAPTLASSSSSPAATTATTTTTAATVLDASTSTDPSTTTDFSTTIDVYRIPSDYSCPMINDTFAVVNSSDVTEGAVISVTCRSPAKLITLPQNQNVFHCHGAHWRPLTPSCRLDADSPTPVGIIVGCTLGGVVCLVLVAVAIFLMYRSMKERKVQEERNQEFDEKIDKICLYVNKKFEDAVGMPAVTTDTRDSGLRGRQTPNEQSSTPEHYHEHENEAGNLGADLF